MITKSRYWNFHTDRDPILAGFIRKETTLNIDPTWYSVDPARLDQLCAIPFIYVKDLAYVRSKTELQNIREYLQRGGFLCIDACTTPPRTPDMEVYLRTNRDILQRLIPGVEILRLPETHAIYHCYFKVQPGDFFPLPNGTPRSREHDGLYGVFEGKRMVGVISMYGLECGWPESPARKPGCMKMIVNIYVYAMTHSADAVATSP
ncbi:MAG TPA: DUF4159 domain-containing protein [Opitutaceae bacterium]|nr:DUF4159 domain-containing protein [Opitutaceae bacterium]